MLACGVAEMSDPIIKHLREVLKDHGNLMRAEANSLMGLYGEALARAEAAERSHEAATVHEAELMVQLDKAERVLREIAEINDRTNPAMQFTLYQAGLEHAMSIARAYFAAKEPK